MALKDVTPSKEDKKKSTKKRNIKKFNIRWLYLLLAIAAFVYYYITLPPIHYASIQFWIFLLLLLAGAGLIEMLADGQQMFQRFNTTGKVTNEQFSLKKFPKKYRWFLIPIPIILLIAVGSYFVFSPLFMAEDYASLIEIETRDFQDDFPEANVDQIPLVDRDTAMRLGNRHLGALTDLVSQFEASEEYVQINISDSPYRVTPLKYAGFWKWLNNFRQGLPHYLQVDNVTGEVKLQTPAQPIKYSYSDLFNRNIMRHLRFNYPFNILERPAFEVDDEGNPYYIATTYGRNFFIREPEPNGLVIVNAMTGEHEKVSLDEIPTWVDRVYGADLIMHQLTLNGHYRNGFFNSLFAKEGVTEPTQGYNYLPINDDLYLYTGITSVVADESNIGFVLVNLRTKEAKMYPLSAAEEFSAMASAEGSVQETGYNATFPLLINLQGKPMYILTLKDSSGLIKEYALIDVQNYQQVYVAPSVRQLMAQYSEDNPLEIAVLAEEDLETLTGQIQSIEAVVLEGETVYYFMMDGQVYQAPVELNQYLPFVESGDAINLQLDQNGAVYAIDLSEEFGDQAAIEVQEVIQEEVKEADSEIEDPLIDNINEVVDEEAE